MNSKLPISRLAVVVLVVVALVGLVGCNKVRAIDDAVKSGDLAKVKALLTAHPDLISSKDTIGITPLHFAADNGNKEMVEFLLANKAEVNAMDNLGETPLNCAALSGHRNVAELLLASKADVNTTNNFGWTPLQTAAYHGYKHVAELLLANQADVRATNNLGGTSLHLAAMKGHKDVAELLLANKAEVNAKDNYGGTPLHAAAGSGYKDVVELLLANRRASTPRTTTAGCLYMKQRWVVTRTWRNCSWPTALMSMPGTTEARRRCTWYWQKQLIVATSRRRSWGSATGTWRNGCASTAATNKLVFFSNHFHQTLLHHASTTTNGHG